MRVTVIILSLATGLVMHDHLVIPIRLSVLISSGARPHEAVGGVVLFALWTVATAFVYAYPRHACWLFVLAGGVGLYDGVTYHIEEFTLWGAVAIGLAALTRVAHREKRLADHIAWMRDQHDLAVHAALRSLQETVPELLSRSPDTDDLEPNLPGLGALESVSSGFREAARR